MEDICTMCIKIVVIELYESGECPHCGNAYWWGDDKEIVDHEGRKCIEKDLLWEESKWAFMGLEDRTSSRRYLD